MSKSTSRTHMAALVVAALLVTACGGTESPAADVPIDTSEPSTTTSTTAQETTTTTEAPTTTTTTAPEPVQSIETYFGGYTEGTASGALRMVDAAVPGSPAAIYARHWVIALGVSPFPNQSEAAYSDAGVEICNPPSSNLAVLCFNITDITADPTSGLLSSFSINGTPLVDVVRSGTSASNGALTLTLAAAYRSPLSELLFLDVDVANGDDGPMQVNDFQAVYVGPDGRQTAVELSETSNPSEIRPGATVSVSLPFPSVELGGTLTLSVFIDDFAQELTVDLPIPA